MIVLGIDPGSRRMGYGIISSQANSKLEFLAADILPIKSKEESGALLEIRQGLLGLIKKYSPDAVVVERLFFSQNQKTALAVAQARGVILMTASEYGIPILEASPNEVKSGIGGYGHADKKAMLKMVRLILSLPGLELIDDASDALAMAIFGAGRLRLTSKS